jgi:dihydrofolate reductase
VVIDMSMSLDGYIAAPNDNPEQWAGEDGMSLHNWAFDDRSVFERVYARLVEETGAVIMGRRSYDNGIAAWDGNGPLGEVPCFVVTHRPAASADPVFTFVPDGIESALAKAQEVAGDKGIALMGAESTSNTSPRGWWTRSESTWSTSCSEEAAGYSTSSRGNSSWNRPGSPRPTA